MAFEGGPLSVVGITPEFVTTLGTQTAASGVQQALGQVWQGAGQSFFGSAGQSLGGALAGSAVNIALNSVFGTNVPGPAGLTLNSGANILATAVTPYVTSTIAAGINQQIQQSLQSAGPFGPALSTLGTGLVNQAAQGLTNLITGGTTPGLGGLGGGNATNYKMFPGGGGEPAADYGGVAFTLTDVVFSLRPANQGPQSEGDAQIKSDPKSATTVPLTEFTEVPPTASNPVINGVKQEAMNTGVKPGSLYDASRWLTPIQGGSLYNSRAAIGLPDRTSLF